MALEEVPRLLLSGRFDRVWPDQPTDVSGLPVPLRLHQVDFCQALGLPSYAKYETDPTSCYARECGWLIRQESTDAMADLRMLAAQTAFDYLIGNCDAHLKNHALLYSPSWDAKRLAPAYDVVCTTVLGYSRELGMDIGDHRAIDDVTAEDLRLFAKDLGVPAKRLATDCARLCEAVPPALSDFADGDGEAALVASEILEDMRPRLRVLEEFARC